LLKKCNDTAASRDELDLAFKKLNLQMSRERSNALSNPMQRVTSDEEKSARFIAAICMQAGKGKNIDMREVGVKVARDHGLIGKAEGEDSGFGAQLISPDLAKDIYDSLPLYGAWNTLGVRRLGTKVTTLPVKTARAQANWITSEGAAIAEDTTKAGTSVTAT